MVAPLVAAAGIGAASSLIGGLLGSSAAKKAAKASQYATDQTNALNKYIYDQSRADQQPFRDNSLSALARINQRYGLNVPSVSGAAGQSGGTDWNAYLAQPDVAANWAEVQRTQPGKFASGADFAQFHYNDAKARGDVRDLAPYTTAAPSSGNPASYYGGTGFSYADRPAALTRPTIADAPTFTRPDVGALNISQAAYEASPVYQAQQVALQRGNERMRAEQAAMGQLESGAALKDLTSFAQDNATQYYLPWADRETAQYNRNADRSDRNFEFDRNAGMRSWEFKTGLEQRNYEWDQSRQDNIYDRDRGFAYDADTRDLNTLLQLAGYGPQATSAMGAAGSQYAAATGAANAANANNQGNAGLASAGLWAGGLNNVANLAAYYYGGGMGGGSSSYIPPYLAA